MHFDWCIYTSVCQTKPHVDVIKAVDWWIFVASVDAFNERVVVGMSKESDGLSRLDTIPGGVFQENTVLLQV